MTLRLPAAAAALLLLSACATQPAPLQGRFDALNPHDAVIGDHAGAAVRWGGRIIRTEPRPDRTCFEIVSTRLDADARPYWTGDATWGRFIACRTGFYDPALFEPNREVTFTGRIEGYEDRMVAGQTYKFPRVAADAVYLWPQRERMQAVRHSPWPWAWRW
ncbi:Slp family lipoprotein [Thermomonas brevis]